MIRLLPTIILLLLPQLAQAGVLDNLSNKACLREGQCTLDDIFSTLVLIIRFSLGIIGAVALLYLVWGGIVWLTSGGNADKVKRGKDIVINTIFALLVAFSSYLILDFFVNRLLGAKTEFQVKAECNGVQDNTRCNTE